MATAEAPRWAVPFCDPSYFVIPSEAAESRDLREAILFGCRVAKRAERASIEGLRAAICFFLVPSLAKRERVDGALVALCFATSVPDG